MYDAGVLVAADRNDRRAWAEHKVRLELGIVPSRVLHGEESFTYHRMAYVGETLRFETHIADIYDRKGGAIEFVVREARVTNQRNEHVADLRSVLVHRNA